MIDFRWLSKSQRTKKRTTNQNGGEKATIKNNILCVRKIKFEALISLAD